MHEFKCQACGGVFETDVEQDRISAEEQAFADLPDAELVAVCDDCWWGMRAAFVTLDARFRLQGL